MRIKMRIEVFDHMDECTDAEVQRLLPLVSAQRREQALRYKHTFGRFCCLKSWLMLKGMMDETMSEAMEEWQYNEHGKPSIHHTSGIHFSISHCKNGIAVAVDDKPVGIDIESIRHAEEELIERTMNAEERRTILSDRDFTRLWTQKEAVVKAQGTGIESFEQLQKTLDSTDMKLDTFETDRYIYSIAYKK